MMIQALLLCSPCASMAESGDSRKFDPLPFWDSLDEFFPISSENAFGKDRRIKSQVHRNNDHHDN